MLVTSGQWVLLLFPLSESVLGGNTGMSGWPPGISMSGVGVCWVKSGVGLWRQAALIVVFGWLVPLHVYLRRDDHENV